MNIQYTPYIRDLPTDIITPTMKPYKRFIIEDRIDDPRLLKKYRRGNVKKIIKYVMKQAKKEFNDIFTMDKYSHSLRDNVLYVTIEGTLYNNRVK